MMSNFSVLDVFLSDYKVGTLIQLLNDRFFFQFEESYLAGFNRPVLSQSFYNQLGDIQQPEKITQTKALPFFSNLLPEGHMREYLAGKAKVNSKRDFGLLHLLGEDLPGAVRIKLSKDIRQLNPSPEEKIINDDQSNEKILKFSLAGVQLKFSALLDAHAGLTLPAHGQGGEWILKLPSWHFQHVPENEFSMLILAKKIGINVPEIKLIELDEVQGLPILQENIKGKALLIKRFDRNGVKRIHAEDFAQVYNSYPDKKYEGISYNNIANMLNVLIGEVALIDFIKRLVFNMLIGNGDMHLKNWSLIYPDGINAELSPAYDFVATRYFMNDDKLALSIAGEKKIDKITLATFKKLAQKANVSEKVILDTVKETIDLTQLVWKKEKTSLPMPADMTMAIDQYLDRAAVNLLKSK